MGVYSSIELLYSAQAQTSEPGSPVDQDVVVSSV